MPKPDPDALDGCEIDFADPAYVSTDEDSMALLLFADLPWTGREVDGRPEVDPESLALRVRQLRELEGDDA